MVYPFRQAVVGMGSNLGDRLATLHAAAERLRSLPGTNWLQLSSIYETEPVGGVSQPLYLNSVAGLETSLGAGSMLAALLQIEREMGRVRNTRWGPRTLDLDLLLYEGVESSTLELKLPHPRMLERAFVTIPLRELMRRNEFFIPCWANMRSILYATVPCGGVRMLEDNPPGAQP